MYIRRGSYGGHLIARSLSPASSKLVRLVFTLATRAYKLQKLRWPFDCLLALPCSLKVYKLEKLRCPFDGSLTVPCSLKVYKLQKLRCPFDGSPLSPAVSKLVGLVFTLATWVYKLQMVRWPFECSFDSYLPSLLGYISCRNYGGRLFVRSLSPAVSRYTSCRNYGGRLFVRSLSPAVSKLVGLVFTLATWVYKLQM
ncbi:hypothetical protein F5877DRAFT_73594, partial [Lentinula edodes]